MKKFPDMKYSNMSLFNFLKEAAFINNEALNITYPDGNTSINVLLEGSKNLPRKAKKKLRKLINYDSIRNSS